MDLRNRAPTRDLNPALMLALVAVVVSVVGTYASVTSRQRATDALSQAIGANDLRKIRVALRQGAAVEARDRLGRSALMVAAAAGDVDLVQEVLRCGGDPRAPDHRSLPTLVYADDARITQLLIAAGANVDTQLANGATPLSSAVSVDNQPQVEVLLEAGAKVDVVDAEGGNILFLTFNPVLMQRLLRERPDLEARCTTDRQQGWTPLIYHSFHGQVETVRLLLQAGANVNARDAEGRTALAWATRERHPDVVRLLRRHGAR